MPLIEPNGVCAPETPTQVKHRSAILPIRMTGLPKTCAGFLHSCTIPVSVHAGISRSLPGDRDFVTFTVEAIQTHGNAGTERRTSRNTNINLTHRGERQPGLRHWSSVAQG